MWTISVLNVQYICSFQLKQKVRQFRTLTELVTDTQELIKTSTPTASASGGGRERKSSKHPDMPKKPLTPYMR